jgi:glutathione S-transferase
MRAFDVATSFAATIIRGANAISVGPLGPRPERRLRLYEFEGCPFCRKVREALTILDLEAEIYPCPQGGPRYRPWVVDNGGKAMFPYLVDPNTERAMYESDDILRYLWDTYGKSDIPWGLAVPVATDLTSMLASAVRISGGRYYRASRAPEQMLELWSFEGSPFCRLVRERLCELELPYVLHNVAKGSPRRDEFVARSGRMMVPWLRDPNTGVEMFESADINDYLDRTYAV